ncbi:hypothetical protein [Methylobacterium sp. J-068]|uniref:hypothetical protein n=1 Tax=Methylobacterium sp. J-068 TaxID=2836649 RepID=UPI001FB8E28D|nr:hypothetical protein [Methylobacterium sp. J-068]MCJ2037100.1 hypothetical protein [Methylobacterium sp. J-068]
MQDNGKDRPGIVSSMEADQGRTETTIPTKSAVSKGRERHTWRLVVGLTGLLGVAWAVAIASRYPNILPG